MVAIQGIIGPVGLVALAWAISEIPMANRRHRPGGAIRARPAAHQAARIPDSVQVDRQRCGRAGSSHRGRHIPGLRIPRRRPAAVVIALILIPSSGDETDDTKVEFDQIYENGADALTTGAIDGLRLFAYIIGMLIVLVALVELVNIILEVAPSIAGEPLTLQRTLGWAMAPVVWTLGVPWSESVSAGQLLGTKVVLNELVAYIQMSQLPPGTLSEHSAIIMAYSICGFANFGSLGIMIGGIGAIVPSRRLEIAQLGLKSILAGTMATCMAGAIAGLIYYL